ncbi:4a-hydroxytetrahydrobiopterin dehydratase, partial [Xanthomonas citri pv. citri]|nr:4a-hydroxytetrahydrobiopterin dehydratase [Xanthomonas citri pv. citri]
MSENAPDPRRRLSTPEVAAEELADWRLLAGRLHAR